MSSRAIRFGYVEEESKDAGPFKMVKVIADGKPMDVKVADFTGLSGSPLKGSEVLILAADDDDGKAVGIVSGPPTKDRVDKQKPGEVDLRNHKTGTRVSMKDNGDIEIDAKNDANVTVKGKCTITADECTIKAKTLARIEAPTIEFEGFVKIKGDIVQQGGITSSGVHKAAGHT